MADKKTEKGSGGKLGQSGKDNWMTYQEEKAVGRTHRRLRDRSLERHAQIDLPDSVSSEDGE